MKRKKNKILIVDDSEMNRSLLSDLLDEHFSIIEAENGMEAAAILHNQEHEISLILLDIVMPVMDGFEFLALMNKKGWIKSIPVIMISAETVPTCVDHAYDLGVMDYISRPFDERTVQRRVASSIMLAAKQKELSHMVTDQIYEKEKDNRLMIEILSNLVEFRNGESGLHVLHIHTITELLLKRLMNKTDKYAISQKDVSLICNASSLHDIGKIAVPSEILNKPGRLTKEEFDVMKTHSIEGAKILSQIPLREEEPLIQFGYQICRWHHERYDGRGYPDGLKGDEIPIAAQVVALADVYDALTSKRVYKDAFSHEKAMQMILNGECGQFNPALLECLTDISDTLKTEISVASLGRHSEEEILNTVEQIVAKGELDVSERTLRLLEREREKVQFYAKYSEEIYFEYTAMPEMLMLSEEGAARLEMPEVIVNPGDTEFANRVFNKTDFKDLLDKLKSTIPEAPIVDEKYYLNIKGSRQLCRVIAKSLWTHKKSPEYEGAIGKITQW
ncbi:MAG: response regulator [Eubacteriales bacterium]|nr:response regulator [Eubacteriales bacterium]